MARNAPDPSVQQRKQSVVSHWLALAGSNLWACRWRFLSAYLLGLIAVGATVLLPWPLKLTIDHVLAGHPLPVMLDTAWRQLTDYYQLTPSNADLAVFLAAAYAVIAAVAAFCAAAEKKIGAYVREKLVLSIRDTILAHVQALPVALRSNYRKGEMVLRLIDDVQQFVRLLTKTMPVIFKHIALSVLTLAVMFWIEPGLAFAGCVVIGILTLIVIFFGRGLHQASREKRAQEGSVAGFAQEAIKALPTTQALSSEEYMRNRFRSINRKSLAAGVRAVEVAVGMERAMQIINGCAIALMMGAGTLMVLRSRMTLGDLTVFIAYMTQLLKPVEKINELASSVSRGVSRGERLASLLDEKPAHRDDPDAYSIRNCRGIIEFCSVDFAYPDFPGGRLLLRNASFSLQPGQLTLLTGASGSGKSTLVSLLLRQLEPLAGEICLDGKPYARITLSSLRGQYAIMLQDHDLMAGTLRDALWMSSEPMDDARIWAVLAMVDMERHVRQLSEGLDTDLAEDAVNFSGGQRARLSLARALLLDRPIMILDEPLANIDAQSQKVILDALDRIRMEKTCLVISHQPILLERVDVVLTLKEGNLLVSRPDRALAATGDPA